MKKVGEFSAGDVQKDIWGDVYEGREDGDVPLWGIVKVSLSRSTWARKKPTLKMFLEEFEEQTGYRMKKKNTEHKFGGNSVKLYIARPVEKMDGVMKALIEYESEAVSIDITQEDFSHVRKAEIAKAI